MALQPTHVVYERQAGGGGEGARSRSTSASRRPTSRGRTAAPLTDAPAPLFAPAREGGRRQGSLSRAFYSTKGGQEALATSARSSRTPSRASSVVGPSYDAASAVGVHNTSLASTARGRSARRPSIGSVSAITGVSTPYMGSVVGPSTMTAAPSIGGRVVDVDALAGVSSYVDPYARRRQADDARRAMGDRASSARRGSRSSFISLEEYVARDGPAAAAAHLVSHDAHASAPREDALNSSRWTDVKSMSVTGRRSVGAGMVPPYAAATVSSRRLASVSPPTASGVRANRAGAARAPTTLHAAPSRRSGAPASSQFGDGGPYAQPAVLPTAPAPQQARRQQGAYDEEEEWSRSASARHGARHDARTDSRYETVRDAHDAERAAHRAAYAPPHEVRAASFRGASHDAPRQQLQRGFEQETGFQPSAPAATHGAFSASRAPAYGPAAGAAAHVNHFATGATPPSPKQTYTHAETSRARQSSAPPHAGGHELRELQALDSALREEAIQNEILTSSVRSPPALRRASAASTGEREASHGQGTPLVMATTGMMLSPVPHVQSVGDPVPGMRNLIALFAARGFEWTDANFGALSEALGTCDVTQRGALDEAAFAYALRKYAPFITGGEVASIMQQMCLEGSTDIDYHDFVDALRSLAISDGYWRSE
ncbi:MAG: hypothetical protein EOO41_00500 [Methanobacteriota archaeon]|nr:MAG: hypothetical protein EOO41_00500 [Euryarchaeota archaeon]